MSFSSPLYVQTDAQGYARITLDPSYGRSNTLLVALKAPRQRWRTFTVFLQRRAGGGHTWASIHPSHDSTSAFQSRRYAKDWWVKIPGYDLATHALSLAGYQQIVRVLRQGPLHHRQSGRVYLQGANDLPDVWTKNLHHVEQVLMHLCPDWKMLTDCYWEPKTPWQPAQILWSPKAQSLVPEMVQQVVERYLGQIPAMPWRRTDCVPGVGLGSFRIKPVVVSFPLVYEISAVLFDAPEVSFHQRLQMLTQLQDALATPDLIDLQALLP